MYRAVLFVVSHKILYARECPKKNPVMTLNYSHELKTKSMSTPFAALGLMHCNARNQSIQGKLVPSEAELSPSSLRGASPTEA